MCDKILVLFKKIQGQQKIESAMSIQNPKKNCPHNTTQKKPLNIRQHKLHHTHLLNAGARKELTVVLIIVEKHSSINRIR